MNTINVKLLNQVACAILDEPRKFDMSTWFQTSRSSPCGTTACIAGWAIALSPQWKGKPLRELRKVWKDDESIMNEADDLLGVEGNEMRCHLYGAGYWPLEFRNDYYNAATPEERADVAFWRIQAFIATNEE